MTSTTHSHREWLQLFAWRQAVDRLVRRPAYFVAAVLTLAFGAGITTAVFSLVDTVLLKPLPYPDADRLVTVYESSPSAREKTSLDRAGTARGMESAEHRPSPRCPAATRRTSPTRAAPARTARRPAVSRPLVFRSTRCRRSPAAGSPTRKSWQTDPRAAIISERFWTRRFQRDPAAVGRALVIGGRSYEIVGVMPRDVHERGD